MTAPRMIIEGSKMVQIILFVAYHKHKTGASVDKLTKWCWIVLGRDERDFLYDTIARGFFFKSELTQAMTRTYSYFRR